MKVSTLIAQLRRNYSPDQEVMAFVTGSEFKEMTSELWEMAVEIWDSEDNLATFKDHINDLLIDAEIQIHNRNKYEDAVDSYLNDLAEKELENENV